MSEPKFTKGPWKLFNEKGDVVSTKTGDLIVKWDACHTEEQQLADSALIAAAPEMYAMLEKCHAYLAATTNYYLYEEVSKLLDKARGEE